MHRLLSLAIGQLQIGVDRGRQQTADVSGTDAVAKRVQSEGARVGEEKGLQSAEQSIGRQWGRTVAGAAAEGVEEGRHRGGRDGRRAAHRHRGIAAAQQTTAVGH